jgi:hypothetical protein
MTEYLKKRPWIWIVVLLGLFVLLDAIFFYVASTTQGDDLKPPAAIEGTPSGK